MKSKEKKSVDLSQKSQQNQKEEKRKILQKISEIRKKVISQKKIKQNHTQKIQTTALGVQTQTPVLTLTKTQPRTNNHLTDHPKPPSFHPKGILNLCLQFPPNKLKNFSSQKSNSYRQQSYRLGLEFNQTNNSSANLQSYLINIRQQYICPQKQKSKNFIQKSNKKISLQNHLFMQNSHQNHCPTIVDNSIQLSQSSQEQNLLQRTLSSNFLQSPSLSLGLLQSKITKNPTPKLNPKVKSVDKKQNNSNFTQIDPTNTHTNFVPQNNKTDQLQTNKNHQKYLKFNIQYQNKLIVQNQSSNGDKSSKSNQTLLLMSRSKEMFVKGNKEEIMAIEKDSCQQFKKSMKNNEAIQETKIEFKKSGSKKSSLRQNLTQLQENPLNLNQLTSYQMQIQYLNKINLIQAVQIQKLRNLLRINKNYVKKKEKKNNMKGKYSIGIIKDQIKTQPNIIEPKPEAYKTQQLKDITLFYNNISNVHNQHTQNSISKNKFSQSFSTQFNFKNEQCAAKHSFNLNSSDGFTNKKTSKKKFSKRNYHQNSSLNSHSISCSSQFTSCKKTIQKKKSKIQRQTHNLSSLSQNLSITSNQDILNKQNSQKLIPSKKSTRKDKPTTTNSKKPSSNKHIHSTELFSNTKKHIQHLSGIKRRK